MARSSAYRWQNERRRGLLGKPPKAGTATKRGKRGITNAQAKYLADLQRRLGTPYSGGGMTLTEASSAIADARRRLGMNDESPRRGEGSGSTRG